MDGRDDQEYEGDGSRGAPLVDGELVFGALAVDAGQYGGQGVGKPGHAWYGKPEPN